MATAMENEFTVFLSKKLQDINADVDLDVFLPYLTVILETEDMEKEEMEESIQGFLAEITEDDLEGHCTAIMNEWNKYHTNRDRESEDKKKAKAIEQKIASIREEQNKVVEKSKNISADEAERIQRKEAILAQYSQVADGAGSDSEDVSTEGAEGAGDTAEDSLTRNMNSILVLEMEKEKRDKAKLVAENKRQKDKEDREKQKDKAKERKESEKKRTQKGERRR